MVFGNAAHPLTTQARTLLTSIGVTFGDIEVDRAPNRAVLKEALARRSGHTSVPEVYIHGQRVGDLDDIRDNVANGELKELLDAAGISHTL